MDKTILTNLPFWSSLSDDEKERVEQRAFVRSYGKGTIINNCNNECLGMFLVLSGEIRTYLLSNEGREVTLFRLYTDDVCVLSASCLPLNLQKTTLRYCYLAGEEGKYSAGKRETANHQGNQHR